MKLHLLRRCRRARTVATLVGAVLSLPMSREPLATAGAPPQGSAQPTATAADAGVTFSMLSYPSTALGQNVLTEADCKRAEAGSKNDEAQSQGDLNVLAYSKAWVAECKMRRMYVGLMRKLAANPGAIAKLEDAQRKWLALTTDDEKAHFPHIDEGGYYGSVLPMCLAIDEQSQSWDRADELNTPMCHEDPAGLADSREAARLADVVLNVVYQKVRTALANDPKFIAALTKAQRTWITYRDAQEALAASAAASPDGTCAMRELARVTKRRTEYLRAGWLTPDEAGDVCAGSHGLP